MLWSGTHAMFTVLSYVRQTGTRPIQAWGDVLLSYDELLLGCALVLPRRQKDPVAGTSLPTSLRVALYSWPSKDSKASAPLCCAVPLVVFLVVAWNALSCTTPQCLAGGWLQLQPAHGRQMRGLPAPQGGHSGHAKAPPWIRNDILGRFSVWHTPSHNVASCQAGLPGSADS